MTKCDCTMGCKSPAAEGSDLCEQCVDDGCFTHERARRYTIHESLAEVAAQHVAKAQKPRCYCDKNKAGHEHGEGCYMEPTPRLLDFKDEWEQTVEVEVKALHAASYLLVTRNVRPSGWSPRMLWARLRRKRLTVYVEPRGPWTDEQLVDSLTLAAQEGISVEVYVFLKRTDPPMVKPSILPGEPDTEF